MLLGARVHAMLLYIVIYPLVFSVLIPLSAYVGQCTFHIYMHSVFDISIRWSVNVYLIYIITWCLPYVGQQPSTYMLSISSAWIFRLAHLTHEHFTNAFNIYIYIVIYLLVFSVLIPLLAYVGRCTFHIYMHSVFDISIRWSVNVYLIYIITWCLPYVG